MTEILRPRTEAKPLSGKDKAKRATALPAGACPPSLQEELSSWCCTGSSHLCGPQTTTHQGASALLWGPGTQHGIGIHFQEDPFQIRIFICLSTYQWKAHTVRAGSSGGNPCGPKPQGPAPPTTADLQMGDVPVNVHGGRHAVLRNIFVVAGARLAVHSVDTRDGDSLIASSNVSATGKGGHYLLL